MAAKPAVRAEKIPSVEDEGGARRHPSTLAHGRYFSIQGVEGTAVDVNNTLPPPPGQ